MGASVGWARSKNSSSDGRSDGVGTLRTKATGYPLLYGRPSQREPTRLRLSQQGLFPSFTKLTQGKSRARGVGVRIGDLEEGVLVLFGRLIGPSQVNQI